MASTPHIWAMHSAGLLAGLSAMALVGWVALGDILTDRIKPDDTRLLAGAAAMMAGGASVWAALVRIAAPIAFLKLMIAALVAILLATVACFAAAMLFNANIGIAALFALAVLYFGGGLAVSAGGTA